MNREEVVGMLVEGLEHWPKDSYTSVFLGMDQGFNHNITMCISSDTNCGQVTIKGQRGLWSITKPEYLSALARKVEAELQADLVKENLESERKLRIEKEEIDLMLEGEPLEYEPTVVWTANTKGDRMDIWTGVFTDGKIYEVQDSNPEVHPTSKTVRVKHDKGVTVRVGASWFKQTLHYDEDPSQLRCKDISFSEGDYLDLRKHTREQIQHLSEFYGVCPKFSICAGLYRLYDYLEVNPRNGEFVCIFETGACHTGKEYHYNDIFH